MGCSFYIYALWVGNMFTTSILQIIGFFSPNWACNSTGNKFGTLFGRSLTTGSCKINGLFYPNGVLDFTVFGLCLGVLIVSGLCSGATLLKLIWKIRSGNESIGKLEKVASVVFLVFQFVAGVANALMIISYDVIGWSAILFFAFSVPLYVIMMISVFVTFVYLRVKGVNTGSWIEIVAFFLQRAVPDDGDD